jgi:hypothetical protein
MENITIKSLNIHALARLMPKTTGRYYFLVRRNLEE